MSALVSCGSGTGPGADVNVDTDGNETTLSRTNPNVADTDGHKDALMATCGVCKGPTTSDGLYFFLPTLILMA